MTPTANETARKANETNMTTQKEIFAAMVTKASSLSVEQLQEAIKEDSTTPNLPDVVFDSLQYCLQRNKQRSYTNDTVN